MAKNSTCIFNKYHPWSEWPDKYQYFPVFPPFQTPLHSKLRLIFSAYSVDVVMKSLQNIFQFPRNFQLVQPLILLEAQSAQDF